MVQANPQSGRRVFEQHTILRATRPGFVWHCDFIGPFPAAAGGMQYVLVAVDEYSGWAELIPTVDTKAKNIIAALKELIGTHGWMRGLRFDNGNGFGAPALHRWMAARHIKRYAIPPRAPQANGKVESLNRTAKNVIVKVLGQCTRAGTNWLASLPDTKFALNSAVTGAARNRFSPFELHIGRQARTALENSLEAEADDRRREAAEAAAAAEEEGRNAAAAAEDSSQVSSQESAGAPAAAAAMAPAAEHQLNELQREMVQRAAAVAVERRRVQRQAAQEEENVRIRRRIIRYNEDDAVWLLLRGKQKNAEAFVASGNLQAPSQQKRVEATVLERIGRTTYRVRYWIHRRGNHGPLMKETMAKQEQLRPRTVFRPAGDQ
jgi:hypothetical protein